MAASESFTINVGTRRSDLALKQTEIVVNGLKAAHPHVNFVIQPMATMGDRDKTTPLPALGKGLWTTELEAKLVDNELDMVVHSLKDMPTTLPTGCVLGCVTKREVPRDVVVFRASHGGRYSSLADLPAGSMVGTSSVRRAAQLRSKFPHLKFNDVRGNIDTRLKKVDDEANGYDCIILAAAGLKRMDFGDRISQYLDSSEEGSGVLHAVGQGAIGIEVRQDDERMMGLLKSVEDTSTMMACFAERSVMRMLEGGCSVPIGVETAWEDDASEEDSAIKKLRLKGIVVDLDGSRSVSGELTEVVVSLAQADSLGKKLANDLKERGAQDILDNLKRGREGAVGALKVGDA